MTLETIVNNMISANEPESNIAMVIKAFKKAKGLKKETSPLKQHVPGHQGPTDPDEDDRPQWEIDNEKLEEGLPIDNSMEAVLRRRKEQGEIKLDEVVVTAGDEEGRIEPTTTPSEEGIERERQVKKEQDLAAKIQKQKDEADERVRGRIDKIKPDENLPVNEFQKGFNNLNQEIPNIVAGELDPIAQKYVDRIHEYNLPDLNKKQSDIFDKFGISKQYANISDDVYKKNAKELKEFQQKLIKESGIPYVFQDGNIYIQKDVDTNSPQIRKRLAGIDGAMSKRFNDLLSFELKTNEEYVDNYTKAANEFNEYQSNFLNKKLEENPYYKDIKESISETVEREINNVQEQRLSLQYGTGITGEINKWAQLTVPSQVNDINAGGLKAQSEDLKKQIKEIQAAPDGSMVSLKSDASPSARLGLGGAMPTSQTRQLKKEVALKELNMKLDGVDSELFKRLVKTQDFQKELAMFSQPELFDEDGITMGDVAKIVTEQGLNVIGTFLSLGLYTPAMEGTSVMRQILSEKAATNLGVSMEEFNSYSSEKQAEAMANVDDAQLDVAVTTGLAAGALDAVGTVLGARAVLKTMPKGLWRALIRDKALSPAVKKTAFDAAKNYGKDLVTSVGGEIVTESGQELVQKAGVSIGLDKDFELGDRKEWAELVGQTALSRVTLIKGGKGAKGVYNSFKANPLAAYNQAIDGKYTDFNIEVEKINLKNITQFEKNKEIKEVETKLEEDIDALDAVKALQTSSKLKVLKGTSQKIVFDELKKVAPLQRKLNEVNKKLDTETNENSIEELKVQKGTIEKDLSAIETNVLTERAVDLGKKRNKAFSDANGDLGNFIHKTSTQEAKEYIEKNYGKDKLEDKQVKSFLEGENTGVLLEREIDGKKVKESISSDEKVRNNIKRTGDFSAANVIPHEAMHMGTSKMDFKTLSNLRNEIVKELEASDNPKMIQALEQTKARTKGYKGQYKGKGRNKAYADEFMSALSDSLFDVEVRDLSLEDRGVLFKVGEAFQKAFKKNTNIDFGNFTSGNTLEFIKRFNQFKSGTITTAKGEDKNQITKASKPFEIDGINKEFQNYEKGKAPESFMIRAAYEYEPLAGATLDRVLAGAGGLSNEQAQYYNDILADDPQAKLDLVSDLVVGPDKNQASSLLGLAKTYDPSIGSFGGYVNEQLPKRAIRVLEERLGKQATAGAIKTDTKEAKEIEAEKVETKVSKKPTTKTLNLPISDKEVSDAVQLATIKAENELKGKENLSDLKKVNLRNKTFNNFFGDKLFKTIASSIGKNTKTKEDFSNFIKKNFNNLSEIALENIDFQKGSGPATQWSIEYPPSLEEFLDYYEGNTEKTSTRSDRKKSLINAIARAIGNEARIEAAKKDPLTAADFKKSTGIPLASRPLSQIARQKAYLKANAKAPQTLLYPGLNGIEQLVKARELNSIPVLDSPEKAKEYVQSLRPMVFRMPVEIVSKASFYNPTGEIVAGYTANKKWINSDGKTTGSFKNNEAKANAEGYFLNKSEGRKNFEAIEKAFNTERDALIKDLKANSTVKLTGAAEGFVARDFVNSMGRTLAEILSNKDYIISQNAKAVAMHKQVWRPLYDFIKENPKENTAIAGFVLKNASRTATHWHRAGIEMVGSSKVFEGGVRYEHAMPQVSAYLALVDSAVMGVPFDIAYPAVQANYKLLALSRKDDLKLNGPYKSGMGDGWNFYTGNWKERYFNPIVALFNGGIDPASIVDLNGESYAKKYNIDNKGFSTIQQAKDASITLASKPLSKEFNKMLERSKGVKEAATYSDARAIKLGSTKGFKFFVPYSAEDFLGLIYPTLGKGKQGDADLNWWKESIMTPYNDGISSFEAAKQAAMLDWKNLKKSIKNTPSNLNSEATRGFTNQEAVRVYLWDKQGMPLEDLSKKDTKSLVSYVSKNPELKAFADQIQNLTEDGYPAPTENWLSGTITTDLVNHVNTVYRSQFLEPWQKNIEEVFDKDNLKKLQATFGDRYVEALEDSLYRMRTGRNRPSGVNRITNNWLNWVNDSVGSIMFFNARSAVLQTTSAINFLNWSDNNPARAAKAFANQKQYWKDFSELWNSDFLKQRRSGLKTDVNADEIANAVSTSKNKVRAGISYLLKKGFLPTQIADSFAISSGGATFYRNRTESYIKEGLSKEEAQKKAFADFRDSTNESQQSSDPSRISQEQASGLGRIILAFANTPIQYTRLTKRAVQDLANGRGDWKTNVSKIVYYGAVQNIIFTALQQAMFGLLFTDDEDIGPEEKKFRDGKKDSALAGLLNSSADTFLRGSGVGGAFVAMLKNIALEIKRQSEKTRPNYERAADKIFTVSPAIDSKFGKLKSAGRTFTFKDEVDKIYERGIAIDNPALSAAAKTISAFLNIPIDRVVKKLNNINTALDQETQLYQSIALMMGWGEWELGIQAKKKDELNIIKKEKKSEAKKVKTLQKNIDKLDKKNNPIKAALPAGTLGQANKDGTIDVADGLSPAKRKEVIAHEKRHQKEIKSGKLNYDNNFIYYGNKKYERKNGHIAHNGKWKSEGDGTLPWEKHANNHKSKTA